MTAPNARDGDDIAQAWRLADELRERVATLEAENEALRNHVETLSYKLDHREIDALFEAGMLIRGDIVDLPEAPSRAMQRLLVHAGAMGYPWPEVKGLGVAIQIAHQGSVPHKTEYEMAAGVWSLMRRGLSQRQTLRAAGGDGEEDAG